MIDEKKAIQNVIMNFYDAFYMSDRQLMFDYLDTKFKQAVGLNTFLNHSDYDIDVGLLQEILCIDIQDIRHRAVVECVLDCERAIKHHIIVLLKEDNHWKISGKSIYMRKGSIR
ncbi:MAG: hypothetical protein ACK5MV_08865 [Aminipila sp.]